jgi:hypothetical protein
MNLRRALNLTESSEGVGITSDRMNSIVRQCLEPGHGLFTSALIAELRRRGVRVPFVAHDLIAEMDSKPSGVRLDVLQGYQEANQQGVQDGPFNRDHTGNST